MSDRSGYIGRSPGDSSVIIARQIFNPTGITTTFTFAAGYDAGYIDAYLNGVRLIKGSDYTASDGATVGFTTYTTSGDVLELVAYKAFTVGSVKEANGNFDVGNDLTVAGNLNVTGDIVYDEVTGRNIYISGLSTFVGVSTFQSAVGFRTDVFISGMTTVVGVATFRDNVFIDGTATVLGDLNVTGDISYDQVVGREIYISGLSTFVGLSSFVNGVYIGGITTTAGSGGITTTGGDLYVGDNLYVKGDADIAGVLTASSFSGSATIGLSSEGTFVGAGVSLLNLASTNGTAWTISDPSSGVATATVTPGVSLGLAIALGG